jgi:hypothetical protein
MLLLFIVSFCKSLKQNECDLAFGRQGPEVRPNRRNRFAMSEVRSTHPDYATCRSFTPIKMLYQPSYNWLLLDRLYHFFDRTSFITSTSSNLSASSFFSLAFPPSSSRRRLASFTYRFTARASCYLIALMICSSLYRFFIVRTPST